MPNNVYIGSRYVPIFDGAWDNTKSYEPLTIVEYGNNTYTSKKPVPVGTLPTNTSYWALTGNYNGQISNLQQQINDMKNDTVPGSLQDQINDNTSDIRTLTANTIAFSSKNTMQWADRKVVFLGDSYNYQGGGWLTKLCTRLGLPSSNVYDCTVSGHSFNADTAGGGGHWIDDITNFVASHSSIVNDISDIVIVGGINDATPAAMSGLETAIETFLAYVRTNLPNAFVHVAFVGNAQSTSSVLAGRTLKNRLDALEIYKSKLNTSMSRLLGGCHNILCSYSFFQSDGLHPTSFGNTKIADGVAQALKSGNCTVTMCTGVSATNLINGRFIVVDNMSELSIEIISIPVGSVIKGRGAASPYSITLPDTVGQRNYHNHDCIMSCFNGVSVPVSIHVTGNKLIIESCLIDNQWPGNWKDYTVADVTARISGFCARNFTYDQ